MGDYTVIADTSRRLVEMLQEALVPELVQSAGEIGLRSPEDRGDAVVGLFLYDVRQSEEIVQPQRVVSGGRSFRPPVCLSLFYMVTAYAKGDAMFRLTQEERILGRVIQFFYDHPVILPEETDPQANSGIGLHIQMLYPDADEKSKIWNFPNMGNRLSLFYKVSPVVVDSAVSRETARVAEVDVHVLPGAGRTVRTRTAAVLRLVDAVTEEPVGNRGLQIQTGRQDKVVWKAADCAVILEQDGADSVDVCISGKPYQAVRLHMELSPEETPGEHFVWLSPSESYPFREEMIKIRGVCSTGELYALWPARSPQCKLTETTTAGSDCISLWGVAGSVEGRKILLYEKDENGERKELVTLLGAAGQAAHTYRTKDCLQGVFHRGKAELYRAVRVPVADDGSFFAAFRRDGQTDGKVLFWNGSGIVPLNLPVANPVEI